MSAPMVVNTTDGTCWTRRAVTRGGLALYAMAGVCDCPEYLMATEAELAEHGIAGSADVLPVPVGPGPRTLDVVEEELTGASLSLWEEEQGTARLRLALASAQRGRRELRARVAELEAEREWLPVHTEDLASTLAVRTKDLIAAESRVAELEAERHSTNEALDDAVQALRARHENRPAEDVTPQVAKLRSLLAGQRAQTGGA